MRKMKKAEEALSEVVGTVMLLGMAVSLFSVLSIVVLTHPFNPSAPSVNIVGMIDGTEGEIDLPIARHTKRRKEMSVLSSKGRRALTFWQKMEEFGSGFSLASVTPKTGRTHQIRVHLSYLGHPIVGDPVYGYKRNWWKKRAPLMNRILPHIKRQQLHAETLGFIHPDSETYCEFKAPLPDDMEHVIKALRLIDHPDKKDKKA